MTDSDFADTVLEAYSVAAVQPPDRHLLRRAHLAAEFALAEWLVRGVDRGVESMVKDAERMLNILTLDVERTGSPAPGVIPEAPTVKSAGSQGPEEDEASEPPASKGSTAVPRES